MLSLVWIDAELDGNSIHEWARHLGWDSPYTFDVEEDGGAGGGFNVPSPNFWE